MGIYYFKNSMSFLKEIDQIDENLINSTLSPGELADLRLKITGYFSRYSGMLEEILTEKPGRWMELRKDAKSDAATDKAWEATEQGIQEMRLKLRLKRLEKIASAVKQRVEVMQGEARQMY